MIFSVLIIKHAFLLKTPTKIRLMNYSQNPKITLNSNLYLF